MPDQPTSSQTLAAARNQTIDALCKHFAEDRLPLGELERRLDVATAARTRGELAALLSDLPALASVPAPVAGSGRSPASEASPADHAPGGTEVRPRDADERRARPPARRGRAPITDRDRAAAADSVVVAVMGGSRKVGRWRPPPHMHAVAVWGGVVLDFRDALLPEGRFEVSAFAVMGGVEIIVPEDLAVEINGLAFMGGFDQAADTVREDADGDGPTLVVSGFALMGGVTVRLRGADETGSGEGARRSRGTGHLPREARRLDVEERRLERHTRRLDRQARRLEERRRELDGE
ncbi:MAG TPA: DUF1707 domain-containing protein [Longimicrobiales bacterium]|nr:DUF1707 domain-containing protein [Longimicrobiales bacterium]